MTKRRDFLKSTTAVLAGAGVGGFPLSALAADAPVRGGTLIWGHSETTQNLDVHQTGTASTLRVLENVHCAVFTVDENLQIVPALAQRYEQSADGLTYTLKLRPGVKFHDGSTMTSADVKYSFERVKNPATGAVNVEVFSDVDSIETPDELTVVIKMARVYAPFLSRLSENGAGVVIPKGSGEVQGVAPIGCGPFKFVRREFGNVVELERFDDYWDGPAYLDRILVREITEPTVRLTGLRTGELHLINDVPADRLAQIRNDANFQVLTWIPLNWDFINFNKDFQPFKDVRVRQAFDLMIDKEMLLEGALWGEGRLTASPSFPTSDSYDATLQNRAQDIDKARALLAEAGYAPGALAVVFKVTTNYPYHVQAAQIMLEWLRAAGVHATIEQLTWSDWLSQVWTQKDYQITIMNFFTLWEPDYLYYTQWHTKGSFNYRKLSDPVLDAWLEEARRTTDRAARLELYKQVQHRVFDQAYDVILWFRNGSLAAQPKVKGLAGVVHPNGSNLRLHKVWLQP